MKCFVTLVQRDKKYFFDCVLHVYVLVRRHGYFGDPSGATKCQKLHLIITSKNNEKKEPAQINLVKRKKSCISLKAITLNVLSTAI